MWIHVTKIIVRKNLQLKFFINLKPPFRSQKPCSQHATKALLISSSNPPVASPPSHDEEVIKFMYVKTCFESERNGKVLLVLFTGKISLPHATELHLSRLGTLYVYENLQQITMLIILIKN